MDSVTFNSMAANIKPMLASPQNGAVITDLSSGYGFDVKLDGVRAMAFWDGGNLVLRNRNGRDMTVQFPDLELTAPFVAGEPCILDGEIVATTGSFQDTAKRDKQKKPADIARWAREIPVQFIAFDVLAFKGNDIRHLPYQTRRLILDNDVTLSEPWTRSILSRDPAFFEQVRSLGMEGVIAKRMAAGYRAGRSPEWVKFKVTHSVTAVAIGYEPGTGARAHFGAMFIAMLDGTGTPVPVGRVGTGFTVAEVNRVKALLDAGTPLVVEIECANVTKDGSLRFPVYKGERTDQTFTDALLSQLDDIPRT